MGKLLCVLSVSLLLLISSESIFAEPQVNAAQKNTAQNKQIQANTAKNKQKARRAALRHKKDVKGKKLGVKKEPVTKNQVTKNKEKTELEKMVDSLSTDNHTGYTKLMDALAQKMPLEVVRYLVEVKKEDVNAIDSEMLHLCKPVLRYAIDRDVDAESVAIIRFLLDSGAQINGVDTKDTKAHHYGFMPIFSYAVAYSSPEVVQLLIDCGADVNPDLKKYKGYNAHSPLCLAYQLDKPEVVEILKKAGAKGGCCSWWDQLVYKIKSWF